MAQPASAANAARKPAARPGRAAADLFVARQPIFDARRQVTGYELLFRSSSENHFDSNDANQATRFTVNTSVNVIGLKHLVGDHRAWVNLTRDLIVEEFFDVLPRHQAVVELLEDIEPDAEVLEACHHAKEAGYKLALDDFIFRDGQRDARLIELADVVKIDLLQTSLADAADLIKRHARPGLTFLAEKVEDYEQFAGAQRAGFTLFQGFFFCKPEVMREQDLSASKQNYLLLLQEAMRSELNFDAVAQRIKLEPSLSVKLLRYINSAALGVKQQVPSIHQALVLLGEKALRQWAALVAMTCLGEDKPAELLRTCLQRARCCELAGAQLDGDAGEVDHFLLGLLSVLEAVLDRPLAQILPTLPVSERIQSALLGDSSALAKLHLACVACERGEWEQARTLAGLIGLPESTLIAAHRQAQQWADQTLKLGFTG